MGTTKRGLLAIYKYQKTLEDDGDKGEYAAGVTSTVSKKLALFLYLIHFSRKIITYTSNESLQLYVILRRNYLLNLGCS